MISVFWGIDINGYIATKDSDNLYNSGYLCVHNIDSLVLSDRSTQSKTQKQKYINYTLYGFFSSSQLSLWTAIFA